MQHRTLNYGQPINWQSPLNAGLLGWWLILPNWRGGLKWRDLTLRNAGTLTNMDAATDWGSAKGRPGGWGSLNFDGTNDFVLTTFTPIGKLAEASGAYEKFYMEFWFKWASGAAEILWSWSRGEINGALVVSDGITVQASRQDAANQNTTFGWTPDTSWHHCVIYFNVRTVAPQLWLDGTPLSAITDNGTVNAGAADLILGGRVAGTACWTGDLDGFRLANRPSFTTADAVALYHESRLGHPTTLNWFRGQTAYYPEAASTAVGVVGGGVGGAQFVIGA